MTALAEIWLTTRDGAAGAYLVVGAVGADVEIEITVEAEDGELDLR